MRTFIVHPYEGDVHLYRELGEVETSPQKFVKDPSRYDLVAFTGGEDVDPRSYGHRNLRSNCNLRRDHSELAAVSLAQEHGLPMTGICRGAQIMNVAFGGTLIQDLGRQHGGEHDVDSREGELFEVNSYHHQMVVPTREEYLYAWATERVSEKAVTYDGDLPPFMLDEQGRVRVTEAAYWPEQKAFAVQWHPEWLALESDGTQWYLNCIQTLLFDAKGKVVSAGGNQ